jgi:hypothetical protein
MLLCVSVCVRTQREGSWVKGLVALCAPLFWPLSVAVSFLHIWPWAFPHNTAPSHSSKSDPPNRHHLEFSLFCSELQSCHHACPSAFLDNTELLEVLSHQMSFLGIEFPTRTAPLVLLTCSLTLHLLYSAFSVSQQLSSCPSHWREASHRFKPFPFNFNKI